MTPKEFAYWLQGFVELEQGKPPTAAQWTSIKEHLATVFTKVTPPVGDAPSGRGTAHDELRRAAERQRRDRTASICPNVSDPIFPGRIC